jgi:hypothetical protein
VDHCSCFSDSSIILFGFSSNSDSLHRKVT